MTSVKDVNSEFGSVISTSNHHPPISYGYAPRQCCGLRRYDSYDWDFSWLFNSDPSPTTNPVDHPTDQTMNNRQSPGLSPWVSPPVPEISWPVVDSRRETPIDFELQTPDAGAMDYAGAVQPSQQTFVDVNNTWGSVMSAIPTLPVPSPSPPPQILQSPLASLGNNPSLPNNIIPPFSCFLNPVRQSLYPTRSNGHIDINNNDMRDINNNDLCDSTTGGAAANEQTLITSTPCEPITTSSEPLLSPIPAQPCPPPTCNHPASASSKNDIPIPSPRIREILSGLLPRKPHRIPLRVQFPELEGIVTDFVTDLIRTAKFGEGQLQQVAQEELESTTLKTLRLRLLEIVPGLSDRGISSSSVSRLLLPLSTSIIRSCLSDDSAWIAVTEVLDIYQDVDSVGSEIFDKTS